MADKPSRGLVLYGDGLFPAIDPSHSHLHSLASKACCGFLPLPHSPPSEIEEERIVREFALLLDAYEAYADKFGKVVSRMIIYQAADVKMALEFSRFLVEDVKCLYFCVATIRARRMAPVHLVTCFQQFLKGYSRPFWVYGVEGCYSDEQFKVEILQEKLGRAVWQHEQLKKARHHLDQEPQVEAVCNDLLNLLGIQGGKVSAATSAFDLVFIHIGEGECVEGTEEEVKTSGIEYVNGLVGRIMHLAQPGSEIGYRLLLSLVISYGDVSAIDCSRYSVLTSKDGWNSDLLKLCRPRQSYTMRWENPQEDVRHHCPMLLAQWQDAVTRMNMTELLSFEDF